MYSMYFTADLYIIENDFQQGFLSVDKKEKKTSALLGYSNDIFKYMNVQALYRSLSISVASLDV